MSAPGKDPSEALNVPWPDIVRFVRQLSHDIRNNLNAAELQSAYIGELAKEEELQNEIQRLREMLGEIGTSLQRLTTGLGQISSNFMPYRAADLVDDVQQKIAKDFPDHAAKIKWDVNVGDAGLEMDPQLLQQAFVELLRNAFQHEAKVTSLEAKVDIEREHLIFRLREPKAKFELSTEHWGREPLRGVGQGRYGLGLNRARVIIEAHGGELRAEFDRGESVLRTTVTLPISRERHT
jgi:K+-sensing histidine kinase KdpD